jgi:hypothetical protein
MAEYQGSLPSESGSRLPAAKGVSGWAVGISAFAGVMLLLLGVFHIIDGAAAVSDPSLYGPPADYPLDIGARTWGWIHITAGIVMMLAGFFLMLGDRYARGVAYVVAAIGLIGSFLAIPYYPAWGIVSVAVNLLIIWALSSYGRYIDARI